MKQLCCGTADSGAFLSAPDAELFARLGEATMLPRNALQKVRPEKSLEKLLYQHAVAVAEKAVFLLDRLFVRAQNMLAAGKSRNQHYQSAFRRVEIREHLVNAFEFVARIHKNVSGA